MKTTEIDEIKRLMDKVRKITTEQKNIVKGRFWEPHTDYTTDKWRGTPKARRSLPKTPITVEPEMPMWGLMLGFKADKYYSEPVTYLKNILKIMIYRYENWDEETGVATEIPIWLGVTLESSLFGSATIYNDNEYPWIDREPVLKNESDLNKIKMPDFYRSGLMPLAHQYYEVIGELIDNDFNVVFPEWGRSPFGVATHIRGYENFLSDMISNPKLAHRILRLITDTRKEWITERAKFLGKCKGKGNIYNDEVNCPSLSPELYEEFALPYELELSDFHGGILYFHSCGDTTKLLPLIAKINTIEMFHVGPWTDVHTAMETFKGKIPLEICLHPLSDVQNATLNGMEEKLKDIATACNGSPYSIRADGLQLISDLETDLSKIKQWMNIANSILSDNKYSHL
jgi:uroporphyrinogen-III decarboxylase